MAQILFLSFPDTPGQFEDVRDAIGDRGQMQEFPVPNDLVLIQSFDQLLLEAEDLVCLDTCAFNLITRIARSIWEVKQKIRQDNARGWADICPIGQFEDLRGPKLRVVDQTLDQYILQWRWDECILPKRKVSITDVCEKIRTVVQKGEEDLRTSIGCYAEATNRVTDFRRRDEMKEGTSSVSEQLVEEAEQTVKRYIEESNKFSDLLVSMFSHLAVHWVPLMAVRIFVEAKLLYGIDQTFKTWLVTTNPNNVARILKRLSSIFEGLVDDEYDPYVWFRLNLMGLIGVK
jgi:hypothetical protein